MLSDRRVMNRTRCKISKRSAGSLQQLVRRRPIKSRLSNRIGCRSAVSSAPIVIGARPGEAVWPQNLFNARLEIRSICASDRISTHLDAPNDECSATGLNDASVESGKAPDQKQLGRFAGATC